MKINRITASAFLLLGMLLITAAAWAQMGGGGGGMGGGGMGGGGTTTVIDPPVSGPFVDPGTMPQTISNTGEVVVDLVARMASINVNGVKANLMTFNGAFPGQTIRVKRGDTLKVNLKNSLPKTTAVNLLGHKKNIINLHTHGLHVPADMPMNGMPPADYTMYELAPGQSYTHVYPLGRQPAGTLNFYHTHHHGLTAEQFWAGMSGIIRVDDENTLLAPFEEHIMVIKDISLSGSAPAPHSSQMDYMHGKEGNIIMINGKVNPSLTLKAGQVQRWRILNASNARIYKLHLENHSLSIIGTDGGLLDVPYTVDNILISPGERLDVLVKGTQSSGSHRLLSLPYSRMGMMSSPTITLLTVHGGTATTEQFIPQTINPNPVQLPEPVQIAATRSLVLSMGMGNAYINGQDFDVNPYTIMSRVGTYEIWTVSNPTNMDHPFHQHINPAQVIGMSGGDPNYYNLCVNRKAWKDVVIVPKGGSVDLLIPVMDYTGHAMFHCHILEHEDIGMMGMWHLMN